MIVFDGITHSRTWVTVRGNPLVYLLAELTLTLKVPGFTPASFMAPSSAADSIFEDDLLCSFLRASPHFLFNMTSWQFGHACPQAPLVIPALCGFLHLYSYLLLFTVSLTSMVTSSTQALDPLIIHEDWNQPLSNSH